jgi:hypothetical protein
MEIEYHPNRHSVTVTYDESAGFYVPTEYARPNGYSTNTTLGMLNNTVTPFVGQHQRIQPAHFEEEERVQEEAARIRQQHDATNEEPVEDDELTAPIHIDKGTLMLMLEEAIDGKDLQRIIHLLPNIITNDKRSGGGCYLDTMIAILKFLCRHSDCKEIANRHLMVLIQQLIQPIKPTYGPWLGVVNTIRTVLDDSESGGRKNLGQPANRIAFVAHMIVDDRVRTLLGTFINPFQNRASHYPLAILDRHYETERIKINTVYDTIYKNYQEWQKDTHS